MARGKERFWAGYRVKINMGWALLSLPVYASVYVSPKTYWPPGFLGFLIPLMLAGHLIFLAYWLFISYDKAMISFFALALGFGFLQSTLSLHWPLSGASPSGTEFSVLSHNVRVFNLYSVLQKEDKGLSKTALTWTILQNADIQCFQEFYHDQYSDLFNTVRRLGKDRGYYFCVNQPEKLKSPNGCFGLAIFSRFPILASGTLPIGNQPYQRGLYADVLIQKDTLRVINVHFQSMSIDEQKLFDQSVEVNAMAVYRDVMRRLKKGFISRAKQAEVVEQYIKESPHRVILCTDLNDTPYSYVYQVLTGHLQDAFVRAGSGFGFTHNGQLFFLRIDHQFYGKGLEVKSFETLRGVSHSDHFPIRAIYEIAAQ